MNADAKIFNRPELKLTGSLSFGSLFTSERVFIQGPCFSEGDNITVKLDPKPGISAGSKSLQISANRLNIYTAQFRQPIIPELEPGWYTLSLAINKGDFLLPTKTIFLGLFLLLRVFIINSF